MSFMILIQCDKTKRFIRLDYDRVFESEKVDDATWFDQENEAQSIADSINRAKLFPRTKYVVKHLYKSFK